jgi:hypothetical protein
LPGNCCLVARQRLSLSGGYRQPVNITVPRYSKNPPRGRVNHLQLVIMSG